MQAFPSTIVERFDIRLLQNPTEKVIKQNFKLFPQRVLPHLQDLRLL